MGDGKYYLGGKIDYEGIGYKVLVDTPDRNIVFQKIGDSSGELYHIIILTHDHTGILYPHMEKIKGLWGEIMDISRPAPPEVSADCGVVRLIELREILENHEVIEDEKDGAGG